MNERQFAVLVISVALTFESICLIFIRMYEEKTIILDLVLTIFWSTCFAHTMKNYQPTNLKTQNRPRSKCPF